MQALKQAARENDSARVEALCETWSLPTTADRSAELETELESKPPATENSMTANETKDADTPQVRVAGRR
jgi:hypothetical protein